VGPSQSKSHLQKKTGVVRVHTHTRGAPAVRAPRLTEAPARADFRRQDENPARHGSRGRGERAKIKKSRVEQQVAGGGTAVRGPLKKKKHSKSPAKCKMPTKADTITPHRTRGRRRIKQPQSGGRHQRERRLGLALGDSQPERSKQ
jgi:hypothetical protein